MKVADLTGGAIVPATLAPRRVAAAFSSAAYRQWVDWINIHAT
ncbi:MAG TPA: hypothetical protein VIM41_01585 [Gammaproteobacteria bacterium]